MTVCPHCGQTLRLTREILLDLIRRYTGVTRANRLADAILGLLAP
jgi:hypothetical protein